MNSSKIFIREDRSFGVEVPFMVELRVSLEEKESDRCVERSRSDGAPKDVAVDER